MADVIRAASDARNVRTGTISYDGGRTNAFVSFIIRDAVGYERPVQAELYEVSDSASFYNLNEVTVMANDIRRMSDIALEWEMKCQAKGVSTTLRLH